MVLCGRRALRASGAACVAALVVCAAGASAAQLSEPFPAVFEAGDVEASGGALGFVIHGARERDMSGSSVSGAGDLNHDGLDDFVIGTFRGGPDLEAAGEAYVVFGRDTAGQGPFQPVLALSELNAQQGFTITGLEPNDRLGSAVAPAGDVNGDGIDDLLLGAQYAGLSGDRAGETYVIFGRDTSTHGGFGSSFDLSSLDGANGFVVDGIGADDFSGSAVSSAGDINGDGVDDIVIGALFARGVDGLRSGAGYVVFGRDTAAQGEFDARVDVFTLDGTDGFAIGGAPRNARLSRRAAMSTATASRIS